MAIQMLLTKSFHRAQHRFQCLAPLGGYVFKPGRSLLIRHFLHARAAAIPVAELRGGSQRELE